MSWRTTARTGDLPRRVRGPRPRARRGQSGAGEPLAGAARVEPSHRVRDLDPCPRQATGSVARRQVGALLARVSLIEMAPPVLARALEPFPSAVRTLDALHLASMEFLRSNGQTVELASYDQRRLAGARAMRFAVLSL